MRSRYLLAIAWLPASLGCARQLRTPPVTVHADLAKTKSTRERCSTRGRWPMLGSALPV
jgi:hypothetical protein